MAITFPSSASLTLRLITGSALSYEQMDNNWVALRDVDQNIINVIQGAAYTGSSNTFTQPQTFASSLGVSGSLYGNVARFSNQVFSTFNGVGFMGTASWATNVVNGGGSGSANQDLQSVTTVGNRTSQSIEIYDPAQATNTVSHYSLVVGKGSAATGYHSFAQGTQVQALGTGSHAQGIGTTASIDGQHVEGTWNLTDNSALWIVGNGTSSTNKSNLISAYSNKVTITGSLNVTGSITGSLFGTASWAVSASRAATSSYISSNNLAVLSAYSSLDQTLPAASQATMSFENISISDNITLAGTNKITFLQTGTYNIQFSAQINTLAGQDVTYIWFAKNGLDIVNSNTEIRVKASDPSVAAWNWVDNFSSGNTFEIRWGATSTNVILDAVIPSVGPAIPSTVLTVNQIK